VKRLIVLAAVLAVLAGCNPIRTAGDVVIGAGQVALGAADFVL
jgi:predicted small secreted protein